MFQEAFGKFPQKKACKETKLPWVKMEDFSWINDCLIENKGQG